MHAHEQEKDVVARFRPVLQQLFTNVNPSRQKNLASSIIDPLVNTSYGFELIRTLDQFLADNMNVSRAAKHLYLHRNTLIYRLSKIQNLTGLDPRNFEEAMGLKLALLMWQHNNKEQAANAKLRRVSNGV
ncbi:MAG TPA: PucR family transcriptional regulator [Firmicutes bacterium]|jgi:DNA-binding PucR family transcriptional regulator|nr:PucR family transcriptional regulator [Bacillota bacterium]